MGEHRRQRSTKDEKPPQIRVEMSLREGMKPIVLEEPAPPGFPPELLSVLADYMERGFKAGYAHRAPQGMPDLSEFLPKQRRPIDPQVEELARKAIPLRQKGLSWREIAQEICDRKSERGHGPRCGKKCADLIRQGVKTYEMRERKADEELKLAKELGVVSSENPEN